MTVYGCDGGPGDGVSGGTLFALIVPGLGELIQSSVRGLLLTLPPPPALNTPLDSPLLGKFEIPFIEVPANVVNPLLAHKIFEVMIVPLELRGECN